MRAPAPPNPRGSQAKPEFPLAGGILTDLAIPVALTDLKYLAGSTWSGTGREVRSNKLASVLGASRDYGCKTCSLKRLARVTCIFRDDLI